MENKDVRALIAWQESTVKSESQDYSPAPQAMVGQLRSHLPFGISSIGTTSSRAYSAVESPDGELSFSVRRIENFMVAVKARSSATVYRAGFRGMGSWEELGVE